MAKKPKLDWKARMVAGRAARMLRFENRLVWVADKVSNNTKLKMATRIKIACQLLRDKVVINISHPVTKTVVKTRGSDGKMRTRTVVSDRSKPGEFPRADTTRLMKDVYWRVDDKMLEGRVGTTLDYGLVLEVSMQRSFLRRTFEELKPHIWMILSSPGATVFNESSDGGLTL